MPDKITQRWPDVFDGSRRRRTGQVARVAKHQRFRGGQLSDLDDGCELFREALAERNEAARTLLSTRGQPSDPDNGYEIFRQALVERDEAARTLLYNLCRQLVEYWVRRSGEFEASGKDSETLVDKVFERFWQAIPPERFELFPNERVLLDYLRLCARSVVIESARGVQLSFAEEALLKDTDQCVPDEEVLESLRRRELSCYIAPQLNNEAERIVFVSFVASLTPHAIYDRHPDLFADVQDVYRVKRNVIKRLSRDQEMRKFLEGGSQMLLEEASPRDMIDGGAEPFQDDTGAKVEAGADHTSATEGGHVVADPMLKSAIAAGFESWLDQAEQHEHSSDVVDDDIWLIRYYCGRWIALRCISMGLTNAMIVEMTGLDEQTLLLLESGMVGETSITVEAQRRLCDVLVSAGDNAAWVADIVAIASGERVPHSEQVMAQVMVDIQSTLIELEE